MKIIRWFRWWSPHPWPKGWVLEVYVDWHNWMVGLNFAASGIGDRAIFCHVAPLTIGLWYCR